MLRSRLAALSAAALLGLGLTAPAYADGPSSQPTVAQTTPGAFTVALPGVGSLTFNVDMATGAISNVVATGDSGFIAATPTLTSEGVQVSFDGTNGSVRVLQVEVSNEDGALKVKAESDSEGTDGETTTREDDNAGGQEPAEQNEASQKASTTPTAEAEHEGNDSTSASTTEGDHEGGGNNTASPTQTEQGDNNNTSNSATSTTGAQQDTSSSSSKSSDGGSSDGGSSDGGSSDGGSSSGSSD